MNQYETKNLLSNFQTSKRKEKVLKKKKEEEEEASKKKKRNTKISFVFLDSKKCPAHECRTPTLP